MFEKKVAQFSVQVPLKAKPINQRNFFFKLVHGKVSQMFQDSLNFEPNSLKYLTFSPYASSEVQYKLKTAFAFDSTKM